MPPMDIHKSKGVGIVATLVSFNKTCTYMLFSIYWYTYQKKNRINPMNKKYTKTFFMLCHKFLKVELNNKTAQNKN